jgi:hypothetical protein
MTLQLDLIDPPSRPVLTSQQAAEEARAFAAAQREAVYTFIKSQGRWGATQREIAEQLGLQRASVCGRTWELHGGKRHNGAPDYPVRIHRTGERRERCAVYIAVGHE